MYIYNLIITADTKVVSEKTGFRALDATSQSSLSRHISKYWPRATLLDFGDRRSHAPTVQLLVSVKKYSIFFN